ncbi:MAG TPA: KH domain-containing protein [Gaiellaceae bacterium]|nr:KH domain-containing protein [Gaiellaceae bacterium]
MSAELLEYLARQLVDSPGDVRVEEAEDANGAVLRLHVAPDDVGKVIGRKGRIARALRSVVRASGTSRRERYLLEIVDPE